MGNTGKADAAQYCKNCQFKAIRIRFAESISSLWPPARPLGRGSDPISSWGYISLSTSTCQPTDWISVENGNRYFGDSQEGFADPREVTRVYFKANGKKVNLVVKNWSDSEIVVKIPRTAKLEKKFGTGCLPLTGKVFVKNGTNTSNKKNLTINP